MITYARERQAFGKKINLTLYKGGMEVGENPHLFKVGLVTDDARGFDPVVVVKTGNGCSLSVSDKLMLTSGWLPVGLDTPDKAITVAAKKERRK